MQRIPTRSEVALPSRASAPSGSWRDAAQRLRHAEAQRVRQNLLQMAVLLLAAIAPPGRGMRCGKSPGWAEQPRLNKLVPARSGPRPTGTEYPQLLPNRRKNASLHPSERSPSTHPPP